ncbi:MAG: BMP family ABC transporter substrate-binding protein, partial [Deltaproteobacteria bacterium]
KAESAWPGLAEGIVDLAPFNAMVPQELQDKVATAKANIISGDLKVFAGPIKDQKGTVKVAAETVLSDKELLGMTWFVHGVVGTTE